MIIIIIIIYNNNNDDSNSFWFGKTQTHRHSESIVRYKHIGIHITHGKLMNKNSKKTEFVKGIKLF